MKFVLDEAPTAWWPVKVSVPLGGPENAGETATQTFKAHFAMPSRDELAKADEEARALQTIVEREAYWDAFISQRFMDWDDVEDADGQVAAFADEARDQLMGNGWARAAIYQAFFAFVRGEGAEKN